MESRRPQPLSEHALETSASSVRLLGRTTLPRLPSSGKCRPQALSLAEAPCDPWARQPKQPPTVKNTPPTSIRGEYQPLQYAYTPVATPSPWASRTYQREGKGLFYRDDEVPPPCGSKTASALAAMLEAGCANTVVAAHGDAENNEFCGNDNTVVVNPVENDEFGGNDNTVQDDAWSDDPDDDESVIDAELQPVGVRVMAAKAPKPPPGARYPSLGSQEHTAGTCRRCCFFPRGRCMNGYQCQFCHFDHEKRHRGKNKRGKAVAAAVAYMAGSASHAPQLLGGLGSLAGHPSSLLPLLPQGTAPAATGQPHQIQQVQQLLVPTSGVPVTGVLAMPQVNAAALQAIQIQQQSLLQQLQQLQQIQQLQQLQQLHQLLQQPQ